MPCASSAVGPPGSLLLLLIDQIENRNDMGLTHDEKKGGTGTTGVRMYPIN